MTEEFENNEEVKGKTIAWTVQDWIVAIGLCIFWFTFSMGMTWWITGRRR